MGGAVIMGGWYQSIARRPAGNIAVAGGIGRVLVCSPQSCSLPTIT
jgi:hypothetical protein